MITTIAQALYPLLFVHPFDPRCEKPQPLQSMCYDAHMRDDAYLADEREAKR